MKANLINDDIKKFSGKSFVCISLTRFCPVGCKFCFFKSGPVFKKPNIEDMFTQEGIQKFIEFANNINLGYLLVSGGGEPMIEKKSVLQLIQQVETERIVLVTSANWAKKYDAAQKYLAQINYAITMRKSPTSVTVRVSVDSEHTGSIGLSPIINLIRLFKTEYNHNPFLNLQIHSLYKDPAIQQLINHLQDEYKIKRADSTQKRVSDGKSVIKIVPKQELISFDDLEIKVGYAKAFYSDLKVNLKSREVIQKNIDVFQKDLFESEDGNSSVVTNKSGNPGLDFWVNYNGNVTTWGNKYLDNLFNLYIDSSSDVVMKTLGDPAALSFIEKGASYRDAVIAEANQTAVLRSKAVNIRDYAGALMLDEARTRLYYTIRALQDYIQDGTIKKTAIDLLPENLQPLLAANKQTLIKAYRNANCTIVQQVIDAEFDANHMLDMIEWINLGHYEVTPEEINRLVFFYNKNVPENERILDINALNNELKLQNVRMTEYLTHIKKEVLKKQPDLTLAHLPALQIGATNSHKISL